MKKLTLIIFLSSGIFLSFNKRHDNTFQNGENVCFVGNSITHGGGYHKIISLFYYTRYPNRVIHFDNQGIGGDQAFYLLRRLDQINAKEPTSMTLMYGMNDSYYDHYRLDDRTERDKITLDALNLYKTSMDSVVQKIKNQLPTTRVTLIGPSLYDETAKIDVINCPGKNDILKEMSNYCFDLSKQYGFDFVDFNAPMLELTTAQQKKDSAFTFLADRVHPGESGSAVMAYLFLKHQGADNIVSLVDIDVNKTKIRQSLNCHVSAFLAKNDEVTFNVLANSLPFPKIAIGSDEETLQIIPFEKDLNEEILKIEGLQGNFRLYIDDIEVGQYDSEELSKGVNLAFNQLTPQNKQAQKVYERMMEGFSIDIKIRDVAWGYHWILYDKGIYRGDNKKDIVKGLKEWISDPNKDEWNKNQGKIMLKYFEDEDRMYERMDSIKRSIYDLNQPIVQHYRLLKVK